MLKFWPHYHETVSSEVKICSQAKNAKKFNVSLKVSSDYFICMKFQLSIFDK